MKQTLHNGLQRILSMVGGHLDKILRKKMSFRHVKMLTICMNYEVFRQGAPITDAVISIACWGSLLRMELQHDRVL